MFIDATELNTHIYDYQLQEITENDSSITTSAISAAIAEVKSYLATRYDVDAIFSSWGSSRDALVLAMTKTVAVWRIIKLCNVDVSYERYHELYKDTIDYLTKASKGELILDLPTLKDPEGKPNQGSLAISSNPKFNHFI